MTKPKNPAKPEVTSDLFLYDAEPPLEALKTVPEKVDVVAATAVSEGTVVTDNTDAVEVVENPPRETVEQVGKFTVTHYHETADTPPAPPAEAEVA